MDTQQIKVADLNPADYNPRIALRPGDPEYDALARSIERFGLVEPIVWNKRTGNVVGGHQRLQVIIDLGWSDKKIPVSVVDLNETEERALNVGLNKITGRWDDEKLAAVLQAIQSEDADLLAVTAVTDTEYDDLLRRADQAGATDFLDDFLSNLPPDAGGDPDSTSTGDSDDEDEQLPPGPDGKAWFNLSYSVSAADRETILAGLRLAKEHYDVETSPLALAALCRDLPTLLGLPDPETGTPTLPVETEPADA